MARKILSIILPVILLIILAPSANAIYSTTQSAQATTATDSATKLKQQMQLMQNTAKTQVQAENQVRREEFKEQVAIIKNQAKKALVEKIDTKLMEVNSVHTSRYTAILNTLQSFLDKSSKTATGTAMLVDIKAAQTAIDAAKTAVKTQSEKDYIITISDETTLRTNTGTIVSQFRLDLMAVHKLVIDAKQAVQKLNTYKEQIRKEATNSARL